MADDNQNVPREQNDIADYHEDNNADSDEDREVFFEPKNVLKQSQLASVGTTSSSKVQSQKDQKE